MVIKMDAHKQVTLGYYSNKMTAKDIILDIKKGLPYKATTDDWIKHIVFYYNGLLHDEKQAFTNSLVNLFWNDSQTDIRIIILLLFEELKNHSFSDILYEHIDQEKDSQIWQKSLAYIFKSSHPIDGVLLIKYLDKYLILNPNGSMNILSLAVRSNETTGLDYFKNYLVGNVSIEMSKLEKRGFFFDVRFLYNNLYAYNFYCFEKLMKIIEGEYCYQFLMEALLHFSHYRMHINNHDLAAQKCAEYISSRITPICFPIPSKIDCNSWPPSFIR